MTDKPWPRTADASVAPAETVKNPLAQKIELVVSRLLALVENNAMLGYLVTGDKECNDALYNNLAQLLALQLGDMRSKKYDRSEVAKDFAKLRAFYDAAVNDLVEFSSGKVGKRELNDATLQKAKCSDIYQKAFELLSAGLYTGDIVFPSKLMGVDSPTDIDTKLKEVRESALFAHQQAFSGELRDRARDR